MSSSDERKPESLDIAHLREQVDAVERGVMRRIDPGIRAMVIAVCALVLIVAAILPWVSGNSGWAVVSGAANLVSINVLPRIFGVGVYVFGLLGSAITLAVRRWSLAWLCTLGCGFFTVFGLVSIWSQESSPSHQPGPGPGVGLDIALVVMLVLTITWARVVWSRPGGVFDNSKTQPHAE